MKYLLFPGRHLLNTSFQEEYLSKVLSSPSSELDMVGGKEWAKGEKISRVIYAVTSFNQANSRYNPIPAHHRIIGLDRFAQGLRHSSGVGYDIIGVPHYNATKSFAEYVLREIRNASEDDIVLTPENTVVLCSTPPLIEQYRSLGFPVLTAEYDYAAKKYKAETPIDIIKKVVETGEGWSKDESIRLGMAKSTYETWSDFGIIPRIVLRLWQDPLLTESGSLTTDRNYSSYAYGMGHQVLINIKYGDIREAIVPGTIVDEGCADAALMVPLSHDFPDSEIIGIELTTEFSARCQERLRAGDFGGTYVHFHQRNLLDRIFKDNSVNTTICNSTTHELWSYAEKGKTLTDYLSKKFAQTAPGGRILIRDVIGPKGKDRKVYLRLSHTDGSDADPLKECADRESLEAHLRGLSTYGRFLRFAHDYLADMRAQGRRGDESKIRFTEEEIAGERYVALSQKDAVEFMSKKDYVDNWKSELNEEFAFWDFDEWKEALSQAGFSVVESESTPRASSRDRV